MSFKHTDWPYWFYKNPEVLRDRILGAFIEHKADMKEVFRALDITAFSFYRYIRELGMSEQLKELRRAVKPEGVGERKARLRRKLKSPLGMRSDDYSGPPRSVESPSGVFEV